MNNVNELYSVACKYYLIGPALFFVPYFFINAPFGRFSPSKSSRLLVDGIKSWIVMEIISPICLLASFLSNPLTRPLTSLKRFPFSPPPIFSPVTFAGLRLWAPNPPTILVLLFLAHYSNRAIISPLRTPSRSKSHIAVPICATFFNTINGGLMGAFLAALATPTRARGAGGFEFRTAVTADWKFWAGVLMWGVGLAGNVWHDEILLDIRRKHKARRETEKKADGEQRKAEKKAATKEHYAIPYGGLYDLISYPNYASEWFEWLGFAIAATALTDQLGALHVVFPFSQGQLGIDWLSRLTPPWLFWLSEIFLMFPRAWSGHRWYRRTFPEYPPTRKVVIPFLL